VVRAGGGAGGENEGVGHVGIYETPAAAARAGGLLTRVRLHSQHKCRYTTLLTVTPGRGQAVCFWEEPSGRLLLPGSLFPLPSHQ